MVTKLNCFNLFTIWLPVLVMRFNYQARTIKHEKLNETLGFIGWKLRKRKSNKVKMNEC